MGTKREATLVLASGLVCAIVASSAPFASLKSGMTSDVTFAQDVAEIEGLHRGTFSPCRTDFACDAVVT